MTVNLWLPKLPTSVDALLNCRSVLKYYQGESQISSTNALSLRCNGAFIAIQREIAFRLHWDTTGRLIRATRINAKTFWRQNNLFFRDNILEKRLRHYTPFARISTAQNFRRVHGWEFRIFRNATLSNTASLGLVISGIRRKLSMWRT